MTKSIELKIIHPDLQKAEYLPRVMTDGAAGVDVRAMIQTDNEPVKSIIIEPNEVKKIGLGFAISINNPNLAAILVPRSGLGSKGIGLANTIGIIDSDYQGEIIAMVKNSGQEPVEIQHGDRIAQLLFMPVEQPIFNIVSEFSEKTDRGENGFGSTGV